MTVIPALHSDYSYCKAATFSRSCPQHHTYHRILVEPYPYTKIDAEESLLLLQGLHHAPLSACVVDLHDKGIDVLNFSHIARETLLKELEDLADAYTKGTIEHEPWFYPHIDIPILMRWVKSFS